MISYGLFSAATEENNRELPIQGGSRLCLTVLEMVGVCILPFPMSGSSAGRGAGRLLLHLVELSGFPHPCRGTGEVNTIGVRAAPPF